MWNMRKDKTAYTLLESVMSLLLLSLIILTLLVPISRNLELLACQRAETEHWRFLQDTVRQTLQTKNPTASQRVSAGQTMQVSWHPDGMGLTLTYTSLLGEGNVEIIYADE